MSQRRRLEDSERWRAVGRMEAGQTVTEVARFFNVHHSVISRLWSQFQTSGTVDRRPAAGRPRSTTQQDDRYIRLLGKRNRRASAASLRSHLMASTGIQDGLSVTYKDKQVPVVVNLPKSTGKKKIKNELKGKFCIILTHGAGGDMNLPQLSDLASVLSSAGFIVIRFTCKGLNIKHRTNVFGCVADSVCEKYNPQGIIIGGRSMGSRAAAMLGGQTEEDTFCSSETFDRILGVICISYPLHRPKNISELRDTPLLSCAKPIAFVSGSSDAMCRRDLMEKTCEKLSIQYSVHWLNGFDHGLQVKSEEKKELFNNASSFIEDWCYELCSQDKK